MEIDVQRKWPKDDYTVGRMYLDGLFFCNTLEDTVRDLKSDGSGKIYGRTAIPAGRYRVVYAWSDKFKRRMPRLLDVPFFSGILIHSGTTAGDTLGCILVGLNTEKGKVTSSRYYSDMLNKRCELCDRRREEIWITIH